MVLCDRLFHKPAQKTPGIKLLKISTRTAASWCNDDTSSLICTENDRHWCIYRQAKIKTQDIDLRQFWERYARFIFVFVHCYLFKAWHTFARHSFEKLIKYKRLKKKKKSFYSTLWKEKNRKKRIDRNGTLINWVKLIFKNHTSDWLNLEQLYHTLFIISLFPLIYYLKIS